MEREIIEQEIKLKSESIIPFPKDNYYTKEEVDGLLEEKADEETVDEILIDINSLEEDITDIETNMSQLSKITETASQIALNISSSDYKMSATLKDKNGNIIYTSNVIDLPLESMVVSGRYDNTTKKLILTLQNGNIIEISVADLISGLQEEITINNKLSSDLVDDTNKTNKFVTSAEKTTWNNKSDFSGSYNDLTNKPDLTVYEEKSNKVTSISSLSTDVEYPSAKCLFDLFSNIKGFTAGVISKGTINNPIIADDLNVGIYFISGTGTAYIKGTSSISNNATINTNDLFLGIIIITAKYSEIEDEDELGYLLSYSSLNQGIQTRPIKKQINNAGGINTMSTASVLANRVYHSPILHTFDKGATFNSVIPTITPTNFTSDNQIVTKKYVDDSIASAITTTLGGSY